MDIYSISDTNIVYYSTMCIILGFFSINFAFYSIIHNWHDFLCNAFGWNLNTVIRN
jgi:hypothetical protein